MTVSNTAKRVWVSVFTIPLILAASYFGNLFFFMFVLMIALVSFYEYGALVKNKGAEVNLLLGYLAIIFLLTNQYNSFFDTYSFILLLIVLLTGIELFRNKNSAIYNTGSTLLGIFYIGLFSSSLIGVREFYHKADNVYNQGGLLIIALFLTIWVCDSAAFFGGTALGKHKLFPRVSPNKSWEGAFLGFIFAIVAMILSKVIFLDFLDWTSAIALGIIIGAIGQIGDLIESLIKRDAGVKDSSNLIPGHGGIFDRFDSVLYTAPVVLLYLKYFGR